ncbi:MAG: hypothetical protein IPG32_10745 [Saprospirales bacterium]|nr:hypothetical protein [Saprospirales bacterium]
MQRILFLALFFSLSLAACKNEGSSETTTPASVTESGNTDVVPGNLDLSNGAPATPATGVSNPNPPHGQPGHRCDIAVGASLDGAPAQPAAPGNGTSPVFQNQPSGPAGQQVTPISAPQMGGATQTAPGTNPPHGQPGHRCEIPVGSPLPAGQ